MMEITPCAAPAAFVPYHALAFTGENREAIAVGQDAPLPVTALARISTSTPLSGSLTASGIVGPFVPDLDLPIWLALSGTWAGTVTLLRSTDGGTTKLPLTMAGLSWGVFSGNACEMVMEESATGATYYLNVVLTSGTLTYRVSQ